MEDEITTRAFLERRVNQLSQRLASARVMMDHFVAELEEAQRALAAIAPAAHRDVPSEPATISEFIVAALKQNNKFALVGATAQELMAYIKSEYGREIERTSISPTLSRMRVENIIESTGAGGWRLAASAFERDYFLRQLKLSSAEADVAARNEGATINPRVAVIKAARSQAPES